MDCASAELMKKVIGTPAVAIEALRERLSDSIFKAVPLAWRDEANDKPAFHNWIKSAARMAKKSCIAMQPITTELHSPSAVVGIG